MLVHIGGLVADLNLIPDIKADKTYIGRTLNAELGIPGIEGHIMYSETATLKGTQINVFEMEEYVYVKIMEW